MKFARVLIVLTLLVLGTATSALADNFTLSVTNGFIDPCPAYGCALVTVTTPQGGNNANTQATITVTSLLNGYQFDNFGFNYTGSDTLSLKEASGAINNGYGLSGPGSHQLNGFGSFDYLFDTGINGGSTGSNCTVTGGGAGQQSAGCTFSITLTGAFNGNTSLLETLSGGNAGDGNVFFAGHTAGSTCTGFVGGPATDRTQNGTSSCGTSVPEPGSFMLFGAGLSVLGFSIRRKLRK